MRAFNVEHSIDTVLEASFAGNWSALTNSDVVFLVGFPAAVGIDIPLDFLPDDWPD